MANYKVSQDLHTARDYLRWALSYFNREELFFGHGTDNGLDEALVLVLHALNLDHNVPENLLDSRLTAPEKVELETLIRRRVEERIPAAYLTQQAWFAGLSFYVDERVLVPRSPIAELIESGFQPWVAEESVSNVLDLCTGSGCIALACAVHFPDAKVDAADLSSDALDVAKLNRQKLKLESRVELIQSDLFSELDGRRYDLIVSNPPYVDRADFDGMPKEYRHEPELGLVAGDDGLKLVRIMLAKACDYLVPGGIMVVEVGNSAGALVETFPTVPFTWIEFERGGDGVFLIEQEQIKANRSVFENALESGNE